MGTSSSRSMSDDYLWQASIGVRCVLKRIDGRCSCGRDWLVGVVPGRLTELDNPLVQHDNGYVDRSYLLFDLSPKQWLRQLQATPARPGVSEHCWAGNRHCGDHDCDLHQQRQCLQCTGVCLWRRRENVASRCRTSFHRNDHRESRALGCRVSFRVCVEKSIEQSRKQLTRRGQTGSVCLFFTADNQPPEMAGTMAISEPSFAGVARLSRKRMSSPST